VRVTYYYQLHATNAHKYKYKYNTVKQQFDGSTEQLSQKTTPLAHVNAVL